MAHGNTPRSSGHDTYDASLTQVTGPQLDRLPISPPSPDPIYHTFPHTLQEFRDSEGKENRKRRLTVLWKLLSIPPRHDHEIHMSPHDTADTDRLTREQAESLKMMYDNELLVHCGHSPALSQIGWREFKEYAEAKEVGQPSRILSPRLFV